MSEQQNERQREKLGALWKRKSKTGDLYFSGELEIPEGMSGKIRVVSFKVREKLHDRMPDYIILKSNDFAPASVPKAVTKKVAKPVKPVVEEEEEEEEEEEVAEKTKEVEEETEI